MSRRANVVRHGDNHKYGGSDPLGIAWDEDGDPIFSGGAVVATTIAGLGTPYDGKIGLVRIDGSSPYGWIPVIYDATASKWVSQRVVGPAITTGGVVTTTQTSWASLSVAGVHRVHLGSATNFYNAGLVLEVAFAASMFNSGGGNTSELRLAVVDFDDGDTSATTVWTSASALSHTGTTGTFKARGWTAMSAGTPAQTVAQLIWQAQVSAGTGTFNNGTSEFRWVSA